jgi:hypothetical protein
VELVRTIKVIPYFAATSSAREGRRLLTRVRVEFESVVVHDDVLGVLETLQRLGQLTSPEVAEGAHHVTPDVDAQGVLHR